MLDLFKFINYPIALIIIIVALLFVIYLIYRIISYKAAKTYNYINWDIITIGKYKDIEKALSLENEYEKVVKVLSILTGKDEDYYLDMTLPEYHKEAVILSGLSEIPEKPILFLYTVNGKEYTLNPDVNKMTAAQFIDFTTLSAKHPGNYSLILSTLLIPKGHKYGQYDIKIVAKELEEMCILDAMSISFFFSNGVKNIYKSFPGLFHQTNEKSDEQRKEYGEEEVIETNDQGFAERWGWIISIGNVVEFTKLNIHQVYELEIIEFLNYCAFIKERTMFENRKIEEQNKKIKSRKR